MLTLRVIDNFIDQTWSVSRIAQELPSRTWEKVFEDTKFELRDISIILEEQEKIYGMYYPLKKDIFAAFNYTPLNTVKVVIIGQDPYPQAITDKEGRSVPRAVGLSFSVRREDNIPSSLNNIYKELAGSARGFTVPDHGDLRQWARQGVLMLNTCLTVRHGTPGSHGEIWLGFVNKVFKAIAIENPYCIYILWGQQAQKLKPMLGERSIIFEAAHPSGLSASRGFYGCNHFNLVNEALLKQNKVGINWRISPLAELLALDNPRPVEVVNDQGMQIYPTNTTKKVYAIDETVTDTSMDIKTEAPIIPTINFGPTVITNKPVQKNNTDRPIFIGATG